jgi:TRAP-type C4-dicarboxylate transport system permease small subunit
MQRLQWFIVKLATFLDIVGGVSLTFIMVLTTSDVILRYFGMPIPGTYEMVSLGGALAVGLSSVLTFWLKGHISTDFLLQKLPISFKTILSILTTIAGLLIVGAIGWNLIIMGLDMRTAGEVSPTLHMPFYPVSLALGFSFCVAGLVFLYRVIGNIKGDANE